VESGLAAIERMREEPFDLVITDLRMPDMSGDDAVAALKQIRPELAAIVVSGYVSEESYLRCRARGVSQVVRKPFLLDDLLRAIVLSLGERGA
jgi:CheY-like chemotaxis protein